MEHIMERIAHVTKKDPFSVRIANLSPEHNDMHDIIATFKQNCDYDERLRDVEKFNAENAWKKRGLKITLMSYPIEYVGPFNVVIAIYYGDGSVAVSHAGIEMGQGINTKVAQVCAHQLGVPLEKITVKGRHRASPNGRTTFRASPSLSAESDIFVEKNDLT